MRSTKSIFLVLNPEQNTVKLYSWYKKRANTYLALINKNKKQPQEILLTVPYTHQTWKDGNHYMQNEMQSKFVRNIRHYVYTENEIRTLMSILQGETQAQTLPTINSFVTRKDPLIRMVIRDIQIAPNDEQETWESLNTWQHIFLARVYGKRLPENDAETLLAFARQKQGFVILQETAKYLNANPESSKTAAMRWATNKLLPLDAQ